MGARNKLNGAYLLGSVLLGALVGAATDSFLAFIAATTVVIVIDFITKNLRF